MNSQLFNDNWIIGLSNLSGKKSLTVNQIYFGCGPHETSSDITRKQSTNVTQVCRCSVVCTQNFPTSPSWSFRQKQMHTINFLSSSTRAWTHRPVSCFVVCLSLLSTGNFSKVGPHICHILTLIYTETFTVWLYTKMHKYTKIWYVTGSSFCQQLLGIRWCSPVSEWNRQWSPSLLNGTRRGPLPAVGHQCLSTWVWPFRGPGQGRHASNSWARMMGVRPQTRQNPQQASDSWMTLNRELRRACLLSSSSGYILQNIPFGGFYLWQIMFVVFTRTSWKVKPSGHDFLDYLHQLFGRCIWAESG